MKREFSSPAAQLVADLVALADSTLVLAAVPALAAFGAVILVKLAAIYFE